MWFITCINNNWSGHNCRSKTEINFAAVNRLNRSVVVNQQIALVIRQLTELRQLKWKFNSAVLCVSKWIELPGHWWAEAGSETQSRWRSLSTEVSSVSPDIGKTCVCRTEAAERNSPVQGWSRNHQRDLHCSNVWGLDAVRRCKWSKASITCQSAGHFVLWIIDWIYLEKDTQHCQTVRVF